MFKKSSDKRLQRGQGMTEYIIIVGVIAVAAIGAFGYFGSTVEKSIGNMAMELAGGEADVAAAQAEATKAIQQGDGGNKANNLGTFTDNAAK
ncbi:MAG TPA: pilus assembly protein [Chromatiaceae bacterium]|nr:pilus assembly protein [Chromatiaceae bacterium]